MSVLEVGELPDSGVQVDEDGVNTATRRWLITTTLNETANIAISYIPVLRGDLYPDLTTGMTARSSTCKRFPDDNTLGIFLCEVMYSSKSENDETDGSEEKDEPPEKQDQSEEPTDRPRTIKYSSVSVETIMLQDLSSPTPLDIVNSAGEAFDPPVTVQTKHTLITISCFKDISINAGEQKATYDNSVNDGAFLIAGVTYQPRTLRVNEYNWTSTYDKGEWYWAVELVLEVNRSPKWNPTKIANIGRRELKYNSGTATKYLQAITDSTGAKIAAPLSTTADGSGQILALAPGSPIPYLSFNLYAQVDWSGVIPGVQPII